MNAIEVTIEACNTLARCKVCENDVVLTDTIMWGNQVVEGLGGCESLRKLDLTLNFIGEVLKLKKFNKFQVILRKAYFKQKRHATVALQGKNFKN